MRIKDGEYIEEVVRVTVREDDLVINCQFFQTGADTTKIAKQLLEQGYADLTSYKRS